MKVVRYGREEFVQHEDPIGATDVLAGYLVERVAGDIEPHGTAGEQPNRYLIALDDRDRGMEFGDTYTAPDDRVKYADVSGGGYHLALAPDENVSKDDELVSAGDGTVRLRAASGEEAFDVVAIADEAVDSTGETDPVAIAVEVSA